MTFLFKVLGIAIGIGLTKAYMLKQHAAGIHAGGGATVAGGVGGPAAAAAAAAAAAMSGAGGLPADPAPAADGQTSLVGYDGGSSGSNV